eukprot:1248786-Pyramimonas_sp.AAC.1
MRVLPKVLRERAKARDSSTHVRAMRAACTASIHRSWLKLYITCPVDHHRHHPRSVRSVSQHV